MAEIAKGLPKGHIILDLEETNTAKAKEILKECWPAPLGMDVQKEIAEIIRRAEKELSKIAL